MTPEQVVEFCEECVLSDGEEPCEVPEGFYHAYDEMSKLKP